MSAVTPLITIDLEALTGTQTFLPFDVRSYNAIENTDEGRALLKRMWDLFGAVDFDFSSPGNSFTRNVLIEVSFQYRIRPYKRLLGQLENDSGLADKYRSVITGLCSAMSGIKTREMSEENLRYLTEFDYERQTLAIVSDRITYVGIEETMQTYANIPDDLLRKLKYG